LFSCRNTIAQKDHIRVSKLIRDLISLKLLVLGRLLRLETLVSGRWSCWDLSYDRQRIAYDIVGRDLRSCFWLQQDDSEDHREKENSFITDQVLKLLGRDWVSDSLTESSPPKLHDVLLDENLTKD